MISSSLAQRAFALFEQALALPLEQRSAFVHNACGEDEVLRQHLDALLAADEAFGAEETIPGSFSKASPTSFIGQQIGPYTITKEIGAGGMGTVYLARRDDINKQVALKLIRETRRPTADYQKRFLFERRVLARLQHPNIAQLLDAGMTEEGLPYFAMEYVEGMTITAYCFTHDLTIKERLLLFVQVCEAVEYAHHNLVVHRDLKPSNILVNTEGTIALLDFGIAKLLEQDDEEWMALTGTGIRLMTPAYASPEQVRGEPVTTASDVYALGVILYELLTDRLPYQIEGHSLQDIERIVCEKMPERPSSVITQGSHTTRGERLEPTYTPTASSEGRRQSLDKRRRRLMGDLDTIVLMALRKEPERRYPSVEQLIEDIRRHLENQPVRARKDTTRYRIQKFAQRHRVGIAMASFLVLLLLGFSIRESNLRTNAEQARDLAHIEAEKAKRVSGFLSDLFKSPDPTVAQGQDISVRDVIDRGARQVETELQDEPEVQAMLMAVLGLTYLNIGDYESAEVLLESALARRQEMWRGVTHEEVSESLNNLGLLKRQRGDFAAAESLYQQAMAIDSALYGSEHTSKATGLNNMADLFAAQGNYESAEPLYQEALDMYRLLQGDDHADIAMTLHNLAVMYLEQGKHEEARSMLQEALAMHRELRGDKHPGTVLILRNLAAALVRGGDHEAAEPLFREALDLQRRLYGSKHPLIAATLDGLATVQYFLGNYAETERLLDEAYVMKRVFFDLDHPDVVESLQTLEVFYESQGKPEQAALYRALRRY